MNGWSGIYLYNGVLFGHKKEWSTNTLYNMHESWRHAKWKKPKSKDILYDFIYM